MGKTNRVLVSVFCFFSFILHAQNADKLKIIELLKKSQAFYDKASNYYVESDFKLFVNHTSNEIKEKYTGLTVKKGVNTYSKIGPAEMISLKDLFIKIDNQNKRMQVSKVKPVEKQSNPADFSGYMNYFSGYKIEDKGNLWVCTLTTGKVSAIPYSKIIVFISKSSNQIVKQEMFFLTRYKTKMVNGVAQYNAPRLQILFSNFKTTGFNTGDYFISDNYIKFIKGKYYPVKKYKSYSIID